jgi:ribosomal protein S19E (S16A)
MVMTTGSELAALLYVRLNRPLPRATLEHLIALGWVREVHIDDDSASLLEEGKGYALTEQGQQLLDNTAPASYSNRPSHD